MGELADGPLISEVEDNVFIRDWTEPQLQQRERARPQNLSRVSGDSDQTVAALLLNRLGVLREDDADRDKYIIPLGF